MSRLHPTFLEPDFQIDDAALNLWKRDQLTDVEELLSRTITASNTSHHAFASRALVRARLQEWDTALVDAERVFVALPSHTLALTLIHTKAIDLQPSVVGYIAKSIVLVGKRDRHEGYRACDIALELFHSSHVTFLLLTKVCNFRPWCTSPAHIR